MARLRSRDRRADAGNALAAGQPLFAEAMLAAADAHDLAARREEQLARELERSWRRIERTLAAARAS
jgi:hypothetical protein